MARLAFYFYGALLLALTVRSTWQLNQAYGLMQPDGLWPASTSLDMRLLVEDVERLSSARRGDPNQAELLVVYDVAPDPVVGWYLRDMRNLEHVRGVDASTFQAQEFAALGAPNWPLIVAPAARNDSLALPDPYIGSDYDDGGGLEHWRCCRSHPSTTHRTCRICSARGARTNVRFCAGSCIAK